MFNQPKDTFDHIWFFLQVRKDAVEDVLFMWIRFILEFSSPTIVVETALTEDRALRQESMRKKQKSARFYRAVWLNQKNDDLLEDRT